MLKILQARLQQYVNREPPDLQAGFRKSRGARDQTTSIFGSSKKQKSSRKTSTSTSLTMLKPLTVWITANWKVLKEMGVIPGGLSLQWLGAGLRFPATDWAGWW